MSDAQVRLLQPLFDSRDPNRPAVFVFAAGTVIPKSTADLLGGVYVVVTDIKKASPAQNKKLSPQQNKSA